MNQTLSELDTPAVTIKKPHFISKILRLLLWLFFLVLGLAIVIPAAALFFFDANEYKKEIAGYLQQKTGMPIEIQGDLKLKLYPWVGLNAKEVQIAEDAAFGTEPILRVKELGFEIPLRDVLKLNFAIETLILKEPEIHLIKDAKGNTNWENLTQKLKKPKGIPSAEQKEQAVTLEQKTKHQLKFSIAEYEVSNATLLYEDKQQNQQLTLEKVYFKGPGIAENNAYLVNGKFNFSFTNDENKSFKGNADIAGNIKKNKETAFKTNIVMQFPSSYPFKEGTLSSSINTNQKQISFNDLVFHADKTDIKGSLSVPFADNLPIVFKLIANEIDLDKLKQKGATSTSGAASSENAAPVPSKGSSRNKKERSLKGDLSVNQVIAKGLVLKNVKASLTKNANKLKLSPLTLDLYEGSLSSFVDYDLKDKSVPLFVKGKLDHVALDPLLAALKQKQVITGKLNATFELAQLGDNLNGTTRLNIQNGTLKGVDVNYYLERARAMIKKETLTVQDSKTTAFNSLTGTLKINNNVIDNNDLSLLANDFNAAGTGSINLNQKTLSYKIQAKKIYHDGKEHPNALPLAIRISGPIAHPRIMPDFDLYLKTLFERGVKEKLSKEIDHHINKILKIDDEQEEGSDKSREELIQEKLEEKLNKGLDKLFKKL